MQAHCVLCNTLLPSEMGGVMASRLHAVPPGNEQPSGLLG
jgi:hypothetical protein